VSDLLSDIGVFGLKGLIFGLFLAGVWSALNRYTKFDDHQHMFRLGNFRLTRLRLALIIAQGVAMVPLLGASTEGDTALDLKWLVGGGVAIIGFFWAVRFLVDKFVNKKAVSLHDMYKLNDAPSIAQSGFYVAAGILAKASLSGTAPSVAEGIAASCTFLFIGIGLLLGIYAALSHRADLSEHINKHNNVAAGTISAGLMIGFALAINGGIAGNFEDWSSSFSGFGKSVALSVVLLYIAYKLTNKFVIKSSITKVVNDYKMVCDRDKLSESLSANASITKVVSAGDGETLPDCESILNRARTIAVFVIVLGLAFGSIIL
jgi:hypothetical protein